jgi:hypothetical protein
MTRSLTCGYSNCLPCLDTTALHSEGRYTYGSTRDGFVVDSCKSLNQFHDKLLKSSILMPHAKQKSRDLGLLYLLLRSAVVFLGQSG